MLFRVAALQHFAPVNDVIVGFLPGARIEKDGLAFDYTFEESQTGHDASNNFNRGKAFIMPRVLCDTANILRIRRFTGICRYRGGIRPVTLGYRCPTKVGGDELLSMVGIGTFRWRRGILAIPPLDLMPRGESVEKIVWSFTCRLTGSDSRILRKLTDKLGLSPIAVIRMALRVLDGRMSVNETWSGDGRAADQSHRKG
jgi:hypothetical protein